VSGTLIALFALGNLITFFSSSSAPKPEETP
jgi:hypothetical protein